MSYKKVAVVSAMLVVGGCQDLNAEINPEWLAQNCPQNTSDMKTSCVMPDLATPTPKCAAAKGLSGDTLLCVDFGKVNGLTDPLLNGWDFTSLCPAGWEIASGKLQVKNFSTFGTPASTCTFTMPNTDLSTGTNGNYKSVTLSVVQKVDISDGTVTKQQTAQIYLGAAIASNRLAFSSGENARQQNTYGVSRADLNAIRGDFSFQPLFQLFSQQAFPFMTKGWQIESIAVMGNP